MALARQLMVLLILLLTVLVFRLVHAAAIAVVVQRVIARALATVLVLLNPPDALACRYTALVAHPAPLPAPGLWVDFKNQAKVYCWLTQPPQRRMLSWT